MQDVARVLRGGGLVAGHVARMADIGAPRTVPFKWSVAAVPEAQRAGQAFEGSARNLQRDGAKLPPSPRSDEVSLAAELPVQVVASSSDSVPATSARGWERIIPRAETNATTAASPDLVAQPIEVASSQPAASPAASSVQRSVPSHPLSRAMHFGGLGLGLAAGAAAGAVRKAVNGGDGSVMMTDANVDRLASTLCRLRGAALKVGQVLSFNDADVLPPAMRQALERVRDGADWMPQLQLEATLAEQLGEGWREHVAEFEEVPVAAASIGQVHRALLHDGRRVAIKVQYPGVADSISSDLWSMKQIVNYTALVPPGLFLDRLLEVAQRELLDECDYLRVKRVAKSSF